MGQKPIRKSKKGTLLVHTRKFLPGYPGFFSENMLVSLKDLSKDYFLNNDEAVIIDGPYSIAVKIVGGVTEISFDDEVFSSELDEKTVRKMSGNLPVIDFRAVNEAFEQNLPFHQNRFTVTIKVPRGELGKVIDSFFKEFSEN